MKFKNISKITINAKIEGNFQTIKAGDVSDIPEKIGNMLGMEKVTEKKVEKVIEKKVIKKSIFKKNKKE